jgi:hypothetical protein
MASAAIRSMARFARVPLFLALSAGCGGSGAETSQFPEAAALCVETINGYRATLALPSYDRWTENEACADRAAEHDSETGEAHGAFGTCGESAQNECPGWPGPPEAMIEDCLAMMWAEGPGSDFSAHGHYLNMSSASYTRVACGFHVTGDGRVWAVQNFR